MTKITKRIWLAICSCLFAVCLACIGWIFTDKNKTVKVNAASEPTVSFTGIGTFNNVVHNTAGGSFNLTAVSLKFSDNFTSADKLTSGSITYTLPGGTETPFTFIVANTAVSWNAGGNEIVLGLPVNNTTLFADGSILTIAPDTAIGGQVLPAMKLEVVDGKWVKTPTVSFTGVGKFNNVVHNTAGGGFDLTAVSLKFSDNFTSATSLTSGSIAYTLPDGTETDFAFIVANTSLNWNADGNEIVLGLLVGNTTLFSEGTVITVKKGTEIGGQVLPAVTLYAHADGKFYDYKQPTVTFSGFGKDAEGNEVNNSNGGGKVNTVFLEFSGNFTDSTNLSSGIYYTLPNDATQYTFDSVRTRAKYVQGGVDGSATPVIQAGFNAATTLAKGAELHIVKGTVFGGQVLPEVTLYMWSDNDWHTTKEPLTFTEIGEHNNDDHKNFLPDNHFKTVDLVFNGTFTKELATVENYKNNIYYTTAQGVKGTFGFIAAAYSDWQAASNVLQLLTGNGGTIPVGSVLTIVEGTEIGGQKLPALTLYMWSDNEWHKTEELANFENIGALNNENHPNFGKFPTVNVAFDKAFTSGSVDCDADTSYNDSIYYTTLDGEKCKFRYIGIGTYWGASENELQLLVGDSVTVPGGSVLTIVEGTEIGGRKLQAVKLYMNYEGKWQTTEPESLTFTGIGEHNNDNWLVIGASAPNPGFVALDLVFSGDFTQDTNGEKGNIYYTLPGDDTPRKFDYVWANNGQANANVIQLLMSKEEDCNPKKFYPDSVVLHIEDGTVVGGKILPALTLYLNLDGEWQEEECLRIYPEFTTVEGGAIRVSADGNNGLRFESRIDYAEYNTLVAKYGEKNVEIGTYILPKHYLDAYMKQKGGDLFTYVTTQTVDTHFYMLSTWDAEKDENGFVNRNSAESDGYYAYYGSITNIRLANYMTEFIGVGYIKIGGDLYLTHDGSWSRSVYYIAEQAYVDKNADGTWKMSSENQKEALLQYLKNAFLFRLKATNL